MNPFENLQNWDGVTANVLPFERNMTAVIQDAGVMQPENSKTYFMFFELYFPQYQATKTARFAITDSKGSAQMIVNTLTAIGLDATDRLRIPHELERSKGWTITVDHYQATDKNDKTKVYENFRFTGVTDTTPSASVTLF